MFKQILRGLATAIVLAGLIAIGANAQTIYKKSAGFTGFSDTYAGSTSQTSGLFWNASGWWDIKMNGTTVGNITGNGIYGGGNFASFLGVNGVTLASNADVAVNRNAAGVAEIDSTTLGTYRDLKLRALRVGQTTAPTCSASCGTSPSVVGSDSAMIVTMGATGTPASPFTVTFNTAFPSAPSCTAIAAKTGMVAGKAPILAVASTTTVVVTTNGTAPATADQYAIQCIGVS